MRKYPNQNRVWNRVCIFISSTINDMHAERDYLVKRVFPRLSVWCERRNLLLTEVDLRWGITEADSALNRNVVNVCLNRIDECRPFLFFLCLLGQRYGWMPKKNDISNETFKKYLGLENVINSGVSITELEIIHAVLKPFVVSSGGVNKSPKPSQSSFFYIRDDSYLSAISDKPPYRKRLYSDLKESNLELRDQLEEKKQQLIDRLKLSKQVIHHYYAEWSENYTTPELALPLNCPSSIKVNQIQWKRDWLLHAGIQVTGLNIKNGSPEYETAIEFNKKLTTGRLTDFKCGGKDLGDKIFEDFSSAIQRNFPEHLEIEEPDELTRELSQQEQFLFINCEGFIERPFEFGKIDAYVNGDSRKILVICAESGLGKSTILANWVEHYRKSSRKTSSETLHFRFIGATDQSTLVGAILYSICSEIKLLTGKIVESIPNEPLTLQNLFSELLEKTGQNGKTIILLDALDKLDSGLSNLSWLPWRLPENIKLIVSFRRGDTEAESLYFRLEKTDNAILMNLEPFDIHARKALVSAYLARYLKELDKPFLNLMIRFPAAKNPLYLKILLTELRVYGKFTGIKEKIENDFGDSPLSAFVGVLNRLENDQVFSPISYRLAVPIIFGSLSHAQFGLSGEDLSELLLLATDTFVNDENLQSASDTVYQIIHQIRPFLKRNDGCYDFFHDTFKEAALLKYASDDTGLATYTKDKWHKLLATYFLKQAKTKSGVPWKNISNRVLSELPFQLVYSKDFEHLTEIFTDITYFEAVCSTSERILNTETDAENQGVFNLLHILRVTIQTLEAWSLHSTKELLLHCKALYELLLERCSVVSRFPWIIPQEVLNYFDLVSKTPLSMALRQSAENRFSAGFKLVKKVVPRSTSPGHTSGVNALANIPMDSQFLSAGKDGFVGCWKIGEIRPQWLVQAHSASIGMISVSPSGRKALSVGGFEDGRTLLWDLKFGTYRRLKFTALDENRYATYCAFVDEDSILVEGDHLFRRINFTTGKQEWMTTNIPTYHPLWGGKKYYALSLETKLLIASDSEGEIKAFEIEKGTIVKILKVAGEIVHLITFSEGRSLFVVNAQGEITAINLQTMEVFYSTFFKPIYALCAVSNEATIFSCDLTGSIYRIHISDKNWSIECIYKDQEYALMEDRPLSMLHMPKKNVLIVGLYSGKIKVFSLDRNEYITEWHPGGSLLKGALFSNGQGAIGIEGNRNAGTRNFGKRIVFITSSGEYRVKRESPHVKFPTDVATSNKNTALSVDQDGIAAIWKSQQVRKIHRLLGHEITACTYWREKGLWVIGTEQDEVIFLGKDNSTNTMRIPSESYKRVLGISGLVLATKSLNLFCQYHYGNIVYRGKNNWFNDGLSKTSGASVALHPQAEFAASGDTNGFISLWNCKTGTLIEKLHLHNGAITALVFDKKKHFLYSTGADRHFYKIDYNKLEVVAASVLPCTPIASLFEGANLLSILDANGNLYKFFIVQNAGRKSLLEFFKIHSIYEGE